MQKRAKRCHANTSNIKNKDGQKCEILKTLRGHRPPRRIGAWIFCIGRFGRLLHRSLLCVCVCFLCVLFVCKKGLFRGCLGCAFRVCALRLLSVCLGCVCVCANLRFVRSIRKNSFVSLCVSLCVCVCSSVFKKGLFRGCLRVV